MSEPIHRLVEGPSFEDLEPGLEFDSPGITLTTGHAAWYQALMGDRMRLPLDHAATARVTGAPTPLAHPLLAINIVLLGLALLFTPWVVGLLAPGLDQDAQRYELAVTLTRVTFPSLLLVSMQTMISGELPTKQMGPALR